jgi:hypothetical protein
MDQKVRTMEETRVGYRALAELRDILVDYIRVQTKREVYKWDLKAMSDCIWITRILNGKEPLDRM